ncbi:MAG: hypothetical protein HKN85_04395, partial [Gammaproteobacteria bacterium]|nr:hypothetical protein [Gammaproteobacteria bacterium]
MIKLKRRGYQLGEISSGSQGSDQDAAKNWRHGKPVLLRNICRSLLAEHRQDILQSSLLYQAILDGQECDPILAATPYRERLEPHFESLGCTVNQGDDQEIETVYFDAVKQGQTVAEDLW